MLCLSCTSVLDRNLVALVFSRSVSVLLGVDAGLTSEPLCKWWWRQTSSLSENRTQIITFVADHITDWLINRSRAYTSGKNVVQWSRDHCTKWSEDGVVCHSLCCVTEAVFRSTENLHGSLLALWREKERDGMDQTGMTDIDVRRHGS
jgi:hypothetical protein